MAPTRAPGPKDFLLFERWMDTSKWLLERTTRFPKTLRHTLTNRIESLAIGILEDVTRAGFTTNKNRALRSADDRLNRLRVLLRLAHEMKVLSHDQWEEATSRTTETGRLIGGLIRRRADEQDA